MTIRFAAVLGAYMPLPPWIGKAVFMAVFALLLVWLLLMPDRLIGRAAGDRIPWWRSVRFWAVLVTVAQIAVYAWWG
jgi:hypothetical protein